MNPLEIQSINRDFLLILREMAGANLGRACITFGIDREFALKASKLTVQEISRLADAYPVVVFRPRYGIEMLDENAVKHPHFAVQMIATTNAGGARS